MKKSLWKTVKLLCSTVTFAVLNINISANFNPSYAQTNSCSKLFETDKMTVKIKLLNSGKKDYKEITDLELGTNPAKFELQYKGSKWKLNWYDISGNKLIGQGICNSNAALGKMEYAKYGRYSKDGKYSYSLRFETTN